MKNMSNFSGRLRTWIRENDVALSFGDRTIDSKRNFYGAQFGDLQIQAGGELTINGMCAGDVDVQAGGRYELIGGQAGDVHVHGVAFIPGTVTGDVHVHPGGSATITGRVIGDVINDGGTLDLSGRVVGDVIKHDGQTHVDARADISNDVNRALRETQRTLDDVRVETAVLEERQRIAREVHDTVAQGFTSIVMHLEAAEQLMASDPAKAQAHLDNARRMARESLGESRRSLWALRPEVLEQDGLLMVLIDLLLNWSNETGCAANFVMDGEPCALSEAAEIALLRATQEALANCRKHARASRVDVSVTFGNGSVLLDVQDDGVGFDPAAVQHGAHGGLGLLGVRERLAAIGGTLTIESATGEGTTLAIQLPCEGAA
jgi:signal transduction histidine kinase